MILALALHLACGVVVDGGGAVEARVAELSQLPDPTLPPGTPQPSGLLDASLVLRPTLLAAAADRSGDVLALSYTPQLSFDSLAPKGVPFFILNAGDLRGQLPLGPRFGLRGFASGAYGALDPGSAQAAAAKSNGASVLALVSAPFATASVGAGFGAKVTRTITVDVDASANTTASPGGVASDVIPASTAGEGLGVVAWQIDRPDALLAAADVRAAAIEKRGGFSGGTPELGWRRDLGPGTGIEVRAGYGVFTTSAGSQLLSAPVVDVRGRAALLLGSGSALEAAGALTLDVANDPLGALYEELASGAASVRWRIDRTWSLRAESSAFAPIPGTIVAPPVATPLADFTMDHRGAVAYAIGDKLAIEGSVAVTTRLIEGFLQTDTTVGISLVTTTPLWHTGGRPLGSDPRPGRDIGVAPIGNAPPLGGTTIEEPTPLPEEQGDEEGEPPPPPPGLAAPPANHPIVEDPLKLDTLKKPTDKKKQKKGDEKPDATPTPDKLPPAMPPAEPPPPPPKAP